MRSPEHALALQSAFKGVPYTPKLPINRTSGHYVSNICCSIISTITIRILITIISTDTITITFLSLPLYYYWWGVVGVGLSRPPPGAAPPPRSMHTTVLLLLYTSINKILSVLVVVLVLHVNNVSYVCVTYVWFRFGSRHFRLLVRFLLLHVSWGRGRLKTFRQTLAPLDIV